MTPIPLSKLAADSGEAPPGNTSFLLDDSNSEAADDIYKRFGWPFVECVVSIFIGALFCLSKGQIINK